MATVDRISFWKPRMRKIEFFFFFFEIRIRHPTFASIPFPNNVMIRILDRKSLLITGLRLLHSNSTCPNHIPYSHDKLRTKWFGFRSGLCQLETTARRIIQISKKGEKRLFSWIGAERALGVASVPTACVNGALLRSAEQTVPLRQQYHAIRMCLAKTHVVRGRVGSAWLLGLDSGLEPIGWLVWLSSTQTRKICKCPRAELERL